MPLNALEYMATLLNYKQLVRFHYIVAKQGQSLARSSDVVGFHYIPTLVKFGILELYYTY